MSFPLVSATRRFVVDNQPLNDISSLRHGRLFGEIYLDFSTASNAFWWISWDSRQGKFGAGFFVVTVTLGSRNLNGWRIGGEYIIWGIQS